MQRIWISTTRLDPRRNSYLEKKGELLLSTVFPGFQFSSAQVFYNVSPMSDFSLVQEKEQLFVTHPKVYNKWRGPAKKGLFILLVQRIKKMFIFSEASRVQVGFSFKPIQKLRFNVQKSLMEETL